MKFLILLLGCTSSFAAPNQCSGLIAGEGVSVLIGDGFRIRSSLFPELWFGDLSYRPVNLHSGSVTYYFDGTTPYEGDVKAFTLILSRLNDWARIHYENTAGEVFAGRLECRR